MRILKYILLTLLALLLLAFALSNRQSVALSLPVTGQTLTMPMYLFFFCMLMIGTLFGSMLAMFYKVRHEQQVRSLKRKLRAAENRTSSQATERRLQNQLR